MSRTQKERYNQAKLIYNSLLNEQRKPFDKSGAGKDGAGSMRMGFPGQCCDGGPNCVPVSFNSASDDCSVLGMDECSHYDCQGNIDPSDGPLGLDDLHVSDLDDGSSGNVICVTCDGGYAIGNQFPDPPGCPQGWQVDIGQDPCGEKPLMGCELELTINGSCAQGAGMPNSFVGNMVNSVFFQNMSSGYNQFGCNFFNTVRTKHQNMINTGIAINANHPTGTQMGPLWIAQKQSKVDYLTCMLNGPCCTTSTTTGGGVDVGFTAG